MTPASGPALLSSCVASGEQGPVRPPPQRGKNLRESGPTLAHSGSWQDKADLSWNLAQSTGLKGPCTQELLLHACPLATPQALKTEGRVGPGSPMVLPLRKLMGMDKGHVLPAM